MVKKTLLQWQWFLEGPAAQFDSEIAMCTLEVPCSQWVAHGSFLKYWGILGTTSHGDRHRMVAIPSSGNWVGVDKAGEGTDMGKASSGLRVCSSLPESDIQSGGLTARSLPFQLL